MKIPKKVGKAKSPGRDDGPYGRFDSEMFGTLKKATVKRNGRLIKYSGTGKVQAIDERESLVTGTTKAVSKIKGRKVISKGKVSGKRLLDSGLTLQEATGLTKGKGKY